MAHLRLEKMIPGPRFAVYDYLTDPTHLPDLLAPDLEVELLSPQFQARRGQEASFKMARFGLVQNVRLQVEDAVHGSRMTYRQSEGLFSRWVHTMRFEEQGRDMTLVSDIVDYAMPFGLFGAITDDLLVKGDMTRLLMRRLERAMEHFASLG